MEGLNLVPVGEMVSDDSTGENIGYFVRFILSRVTEACLNHLVQIGTDDSWANVHAIFSINTLKGKNINVGNFFQFAFEAFKSGKLPAELVGVITAAYCFSHQSKNWSKDLDKAYPAQKQIKIVLLSIIQSFTTIENPANLDRLIKAFIFKISSVFKDDVYESAQSVVAVHHGFSDQVTDLPVHSAKIEEPNGGSMFRESPFYQHFFDFWQTTRMRKYKKNLEKNQFFNEEFLEKFLEQYIATLPLWTVFVSRLQIPNATRNNNARVERFFGILKNECEEEIKQLTRLGNIRVGCYAKSRMLRVNQICNKVNANLPNKQLNQTHKSQTRSMSSVLVKTTELKPNEESFQVLTVQKLSECQETWKKGRRPKAYDKTKLQRKLLLKDLKIE